MMMQWLEIRMLSGICAMISSQPHPKNALEEPDWRCYRATGRLVRSEAVLLREKVSSFTHE
jgi:hypothetical protein